MPQLTYHQKEQAVYDYLTNQLEKSQLYFSLRRNGSPAARRDLFIGTEKSNYFKFSLWAIPIGFPGSAGNFIDFVVHESNDNNWTFKLESFIPKNVTGTQNINSLAFSRKLIQYLKNDFPQYDYIQTQEKHKNLLFELRYKKSFKDFDKLVIALKSFIQELTPYIDKHLEEFKKDHFEWKARRFNLEDWKQFNASYQRRLIRYPEKVDNQDEKSEIETTAEDVIENELPYFPLNQILYGPPGTGKTYYTLSLALKILGHPLIESREEQIKAYEKERKEGKIVFTTFHQSMSYEDFVEGIKPVLDDETSDLGYEIKDGILKSVSKLAIQEYVKYNDEKFLSFDERYDQLLDNITTSDEGFKLNSRSGNTIILQEVSVRGNITVIHENGSRSYIVSKTRLEKLFHALDPQSEVSNINNAIRSIIGGSNATAYWAVNEYLHSLSGDKKSYYINPNLSDIQYQNILRTVDWQEAESLNVDRYVIIIDEINRGNVSGIFGELITLLENDKRIDEKNRLVLKLPYSKVDFALPSNLYIIGTMNTADRSVEALDTALRRRFSFREVMPNPKVLQEQEEGEGSDDIEGIDLVDVLRTINKRIKMLIDRDHQIGHSYFLGINSIEDLRDTFKNKIIPLLQEYFYNDYGKMMLVLGAGFVKKQILNSTLNHFAIPMKDLDIDLPDCTHELAVFDDTFDIYEAVKLLLDPTYTNDSE